MSSECVMWYVFATPKMVVYFGSSGCSMCVPYPPRATALTPETAATFSQTDPELTRAAIPERAQMGGAEARRESLLKYHTPGFLG